MMPVQPGLGLLPTILLKQSGRLSGQSTSILTAGGAIEPNVCFGSKAGIR